MTTSKLELTTTERFSVLSIDDGSSNKKSSKTVESNTQSTSKSKQQTKGSQNKEEKKNNNKSKKESKQKKQKEKQQPKEQQDEAVWTPDLQKKYESVLSIGEECISAEELKTTMLRNASKDIPFRLYDGFEPSGRMHIAQGVFKAMNVNKATSSNGHFIFWVADWFALMNDKMSGDLSKIKTVGRYLIEVWRAAGMLRLDSHVHFLWASDEITSNASTYWPLMLDVGRRFNVTRIKKCCQIMGRLEGRLTAAQVLYPLMQCTDVFFLKTDVCQLGVDQRKVNMLAREYAEAAKKKKPVILSHHMLYGLKAGQEKMSKSDPDSAVFMEDTKEDVERKINAAYCPREVTSDGGQSSMSLIQDDLKNPCLDYIQNIIFAPPDATFSTSQRTYDNFPSVREDFLSGQLSEADLKSALIAALNDLLEPVRCHFSSNETAKTLLNDVRRFKKEAAADNTPQRLRKLDLVAANVIPAGKPVHWVSLPLPSVKPTLQQAVDVLTCVDASAGSHVVLFIPDWSARVCNALDADVKAIDAYYKVLVCALRHLGLREEGVTVLTQSEAILKDPSNYWISVINVGRFFQLDEVMGTDMKDSDGVGTVIARLMKVADTLAISPSSAAVSLSDASAMIEISLIDKYLTFVSSSHPEQIKCKFQQIPTPDLLLMRRDNEAHKTDLDEFYLMDDPKVHAKSKMKKSFCEPSNIEFNPAIALSTHFSAGNEVLISRSPDNGGDVTYTARSDMERDFASGALHPGDLKAAASKIMVEVLTKLSTGLKADVAKDMKTLKAMEKKMNKKK